MAIRVLMYGLGPIGAAVARQVASRKGFQIVGAVDIDRAKIGLDLGQVIGLDKKLRVRITNDAAGAIKSGKPDVAVLCTSSSLKSVMPQIEAVLKKKVAIVSTTEELSYPVGKNRALAKKIDALAKKAKVAVVGTGVNPGLRDGRAADHADRHLRARRQHPRRSHPGRAHAPPAVPAEDRLRPQHRSSSRRR